MKKKIIDIVKNKFKGTVNLREKNLKKKVLNEEKDEVFFEKRDTPIKKIIDIRGEKEEHFQYVKGRRFNPPKFIGEIVKMAFLGFLIILIINAANVYIIGKNLEKDITETAHSAYENLLSASKNTGKIQFEKAQKEFDEALENFNQAENELWFVSKMKSFYSDTNTLSLAADALINGGRDFSIAGKNFVLAVEQFSKIPVYFTAQNSEEEDKKQDLPSITETLKEGLKYTNIAISKIKKASEKINKVEEKRLPKDLGERMKMAKEKINTVEDTLDAIQKHFPALLTLLGDRYPHRYLILLQNNNEMRPTGGFIGSYIIFDINDGYIENLKTHDVYKLDGSYTGIIEPPEEFKNFTSNWRFRDSNYSPDFYYSASKARWFLEKEGGPTVDTVIAINQGLLTSLLDITGPIQVGNFGKFNSQNYNLLLSYVIEGKVWGPEDPKHILKVFIKEFKKELIKTENLAKIISILYKATMQKHILLYSSDGDIQALFEELKIAGRTHDVKKGEDYLSVINISIGGSKSEQFVREEITHTTEVSKLGEVVDEVVIKRTHMWNDEILKEWTKIIKDYGFSFLPSNLVDILGRGANKVVMKVYVPTGSILISSNREDIKKLYDSDTKKDYFMTIVSVNAGESDEVVIKYRPPITLRLNPVDTYKLITEKQPGSVGSSFTKILKTDSSLKNLSFYPPECANYGNETSYFGDLVYDRFFSEVISK